MLAENCLPLSCDGSPLWAQLGLLALEIKRPLSSFTDPNAAAALAMPWQDRVAVSRHPPYMLSAKSFPY